MAGSDASEVLAPNVQRQHASSPTAAHSFESRSAVIDAAHLDFVIIDADHVYDSVIADLRAWSVKECAMSWQCMNPDHQVIRLDAQTLQGWCRWKNEILDIDSKTISKAAASELIRHSLLKRYGGIWADATT